METRNLTCIGCPMGCQLTVTYESGNKESIAVTGNTCPRGKAYAIDEVTNPTRIVTGTCCLSNRPGMVISLKTQAQVPKDKVMDVAAELRKLKVTAPRRIGDVLCKDIAGTGVDVIATKNID